MSSPELEVKVPLYEGSTQFKNWRLSVEQLAYTRETLNKAATTAIQNTFENDEPGSSKNVTFLSADEEVLLIRLYITKITQLCGLFRFPEEVEATAVSYLKRFYLKNTVMDWHPKNVMCIQLTALFLATKTTNHPISLEVYTSHIPKTTPQDVLDLEFLVAQSLNFEFAIWHAHRCLWGVWLDMQKLVGETEQLEPGLHETALNHVRTSRLTDAELIYSPSQIALAAFSLAHADLALKWMGMKVSQPTEVDQLKEVVNHIQMLIASDGQPPSVEAVREVDRRLRLCKNPEKVVGSKAYLAKKLEDERITAEKRNRKLAENQLAQTNEHGDFFGNELKPKGLVNYDDDN